MRSQKEHSFLLVFLLPILGDQDEGLLQIEISRAGVAAALDFREEKLENQRNGHRDVHWGMFVTALCGMSRRIHSYTLQ